MKWKLLFDSSAALRILSNFGDRLVYSLPSMQFSASFESDVWPTLAVYSTSRWWEKVVWHISLGFSPMKNSRHTVKTGFRWSKTSSMMIHLKLMESRCPHHPITLFSCDYMTDFGDVLTVWLNVWINIYKMCMCTPAQECESSQMAASPASKKCSKLPGLLLKTKQKGGKKSTSREKCSK